MPYKSMLISICNFVQCALSECKQNYSYVKKQHLILPFNG